MCSANDLHPAANKISVCLKCVFAFIHDRTSANWAELRGFREISVSTDRAEFKLAIFPQSHDRPREFPKILELVVKSFSAAWAIHGSCSPASMAYPTEPTGTLRKLLHKTIKIGINLSPDFQFQRQFMQAPVRRRLRKAKRCHNQHFRMRYISKILQNRSVRIRQLPVSLPFVISEPMLFQNPVNSWCRGKNINTE